MRVTIDPCAERSDIMIASWADLTCSLMAMKPATKESKGGDVSCDKARTSDARSGRDMSRSRFGWFVQ